MENVPSVQEFEFLDFTDINDLERGRLLHLLYSGRNESWVCEEDGFKHLDFPWTFRGTQAQTLPSPNILNEVQNIPHISDWNTAADEYVNGDAEPENPVMINGGNFVPGPPPVFQMMPNPPVYMGNVPPPVHGYVPSQMSPYQQPMYPGPEPPMDPNHRRPNISRNPKGIPPPPNVKRNNDMAYRHPDNIEMANYQTPPTYIAVPPPHYYYSPQNSPLYLPPHHGHPSYPMYTHPHPTMYNPYPQPGPPMYHSPPAGQVPQQPLLVESCKPNVNPIPSVHNIYPQVPENIVNEIPVDQESIPVPQDKEVELQVQADQVNVDFIEVKPEEPNDEILDSVQEVPLVESIVPVESVEKKEPSSTSVKSKKKKEFTTNGLPNLVEENLKPKKEMEKEETKKEELTSSEKMHEETLLNQEQTATVFVPPVKLEETEPVKPVAKTWAGLFSGCPSTSNDKVFTLHGSSQPSSNTNSEPIVMPSRSIPDNTIRSTVFTANINQKQTLPAKPRPSNSNSLSSVDDNTLHLQKLGEFLSMYNLDHKTVHLQPRGLTNRNTRCYINATLQALLTCPPFFNLMRSVQYKLKNRNPRGAHKSQTPILESMVQFIGEFQQFGIKNGRLIQQRQATSVASNEIPDVGQAFEPSYVYKILPAFEEGRQEDAEEFMSYLLNGINDEMIELIKLSKSNVSNGETQADIDSVDNNNEWKEVNGKHKMVTRRTVMEKTPLSEIFRGQLRTRTVKNGENEPTENIEPFFTLKLDIEKAKSVREALDMLVTKDTLEGLTCPKTNRELDAYQQVTIDELPYVLLLHLKCFEYKQQKLTKIVKNVEFSVDLKIEPKLISKNSKNSMKTRQYKLFAVVYHDGKEATKGHYFADVFYVALGRWLRFDDASVRFVTDKEVCQPKPPCMPYLLYYRRNDTIAALSGFDNKGR